MARTLIIDVEAIKAHLSTLVNDGLEKLFQQVTGAIAVFQKDEKTAEHGLSGMREQIMANVEILLPIMGSKQCSTFYMGTRSITPEVHVVTVGQEPNIKAYVFQGPADRCKKFLDADAGATAGEALKKLLVLTQQMLDFHIDEIGNSAANGVATRNVSLSDDWSSSAYTNPAATFSFSYAGSDTSNDSALGNCGSFPITTSALTDGFSTASTLYDVNKDVYYTY